MTCYITVVARRAILYPEWGVNTPKTQNVQYCPGTGQQALEGAEKTLGGTLMGRRLWMMLRVRKMLLEDGGKSPLDADGKLRKTAAAVV